jgi:drug/metabolite transporter (DMT)-like permease
VASVLLALLAGALFGAMAVAVRTGLRRCSEPEIGAAVLAAVAAVTGALVALAGGDLTGDRLELKTLWPFLLAGAFVPGVSQLLFVFAVRGAGPSRTAILVGTAPLLSAFLAVALLDEPLRPVLALGTVAVVLGGALLAWEPVRPRDFRAVGAVLALVCAVLFALRDNVVRWASLEGDAPALAAAAASLTTASAVLLGYVALANRENLLERLRLALPAFFPAGLFLGLAYTALVAAFAEGRVTVVAPLNATQSLWAVAFAAFALGRRAEAIGVRLVGAALLVVAGSALVGAFR